MSDCTISNPVLTIEWAISSIDVEKLGLFFGSSLLLWGVGIGIGLMLAQIRKFRV